MQKLIIILFLQILISAKAFSQPVTWFKPFEQFGSLFKVQQTFDGNYMAVGTSDNLVFIIKVNEYCDTIWTRKLGNPNFVYDGWWIEEMKDGNIINGVSSEGVMSDVYLTKTDQKGIQLWERLYGGDSAEKGLCLKGLTDKNLILMNNQAHPFIESIRTWLIKTDSMGTPIWDKFIRSDLKITFPSEIDLVNDGFILLTSSYTLQQSSYIWLLRLNENGDTLWTRKFNNNIQSGTVGYGVQTVTTGGFIVLGRTSLTTYPNISYVIKTDSSGNMEWDRTYRLQSAEYAHSIREIPGRGYVFCGLVSSQDSFRAFIRVIDYDGNVISEKIYQVPDASYTEFRSVEVTRDGGFILCGIYQYPGGLVRFLMAKTDSLGSIHPVSVNPVSSTVPSEYKLYQNHPNPFNPSTNIKFDLPQAGLVKLSVFDILGREVAVLVNEKLNAGTYNYQLSMDDYQLKSGVYFYKLEARHNGQAGDFVQTKKMVLLK